MSRRFSKCLNTESKAFNSPVAALALGAVFLLLGLSLLGFMYGAAAGIIGYASGCWLSKNWHEGKIQGWLYWNLPISRIVIGDKIPKSHNREFH